MRAGGLARPMRFPRFSFSNSTELLRLVAAGLGLAGALSLRGDDTPVPPPSDEELRIREVFASHLPNTLPEDAVRFTLRPHFADLSQRDYFRLTTGVHYGLTPIWEIDADTDVYFSHGLRHVALFKEGGFAELNLGTKVDLGPWPWDFWDAAAGVDFSTPLGRPPAELTDGLRHFAPYATFSRRLKNRPHLRVFWGTGLDLVSHTGVAGEFGKNEVHDHATVLSAGVVWDRRQYHYTFETTWTSTNLFGHTRENTLELRPGLIWELPSRRDARAGRVWLIGSSLRFSFGPDGTDVGAAVRLQLNFDPHKWTQR